jgi:hypothetical protein
MIKIEQDGDFTRLSAAVTDFSESLGYCQYKIPLSIRGEVGEPSEALIKGSAAHHEEEVYEQEHVVLEPVTIEKIQDPKQNIEFSREYVYTSLHVPFEFQSQSVMVSLYGRIDKMLRVGSTLIVQDDKFTSKPKSYDSMTSPYPGQMLQVLTYLNSLYSMKRFATPLDYFEVPHEQKQWQIRICDNKTKNPYKVFTDYQNDQSQKYLHSSLRLFASIAVGQTEPVHHNSKSKCNACNLKESCEFRL